MNETEKSLRCPVSISWICVFTILGGLFAFAIMFSSAFQSIALSIKALAGISILVNLICAFGWLKMKKWAVYTYVVSVIVGTIISLVTGSLTLFSIIIPGITIYFLVKHFSKMT